MRRHFEKITRQASRAIRHWWLYMVCGILSIAAGIGVFVFPMDSYMTMGVFFGVLMLTVGAAQLITASTSGNYLAMKGYMITGGVLDLILGLLLCFNPGISLIVMPVLLGVWMLYHSFMVIAFGGDMSTFKISGSWMITAGGIVLMLVSILILVNPMRAGVAAVVFLAGAGLIVLGILLSALAIKLKDMHRFFEPEM